MLRPSISFCSVLKSASHCSACEEIELASAPSAATSVAKERLTQLQPATRRVALPAAIKGHGLTLGDPLVQEGTHGLIRRRREASTGARGLPFSTYATLLYPPGHPAGLDNTGRSVGAMWPAKARKVGRVRLELAVKLARGRAAEIAEASRPLRGGRGRSSLSTAGVRSTATIASTSSRGISTASAISHGSGSRSSLTASSRARGRPCAPAGHMGGQADGAAACCPGRAGSPGGSTASRRWRSGSPCASRTSRRRGSARACPPDEVAAASARGPVAPGDRDDESQVAS